MQPTSLILTLALAAAAPAAKPAAGSDPRKLWAYPKGVIVTSDGGRVSPTKDEKDKEKEKEKEKDKDKAREADSDEEKEKAKARDKERDDAIQASADELTAVGHALETKLSDCLSALRAKTPDAATKGAKYRFGFEFTIAADGSLDDLQMQKHPGSETLPDCADQAKQQLSSHRFEPPALGQPLEARLDLDGVILTDSEAKGRGYEFYEAETAWEQAKKGHQEWFACHVDADCSVTDEHCEVRGLNKAFLAAYHQAAEARKKTPCRSDVDLSSFKAACHKGVCAAHRR